VRVHRDDIVYYIKYKPEIADNIKMKKSYTCKTVVVLLMLFISTLMKDSDYLYEHLLHKQSNLVKHIFLYNLFKQILNNWHFFSYLCNVSLCIIGRVTLYYV